MSDAAVPLGTDGPMAHLGYSPTGVEFPRVVTNKERATRRRRLAAVGRTTGEFDDDLELIAASRRGDIDAFTMLLERHRRRMQRLCISLTSNREDAQDALQAAQIALWRKLDQFEGRAKFTTWLYQVVLHTTLGELRRRRPEPVDPDTTETPDQLDIARHVTDVEAVRWALDRLPEPYRVTLILSAFEGLAQAEIAEILIISEGTVKSRLSRARDILHHLLSEAPT